MTPTGLVDGKESYVARSASRLNRTQLQLEQEPNTTKAKETDQSSKDAGKNPEATVDTAGAAFRGRIGTIQLTWLPRTASPFW